MSYQNQPSVGVPKVETLLMRSGKFRLLGKKSLLQPEHRPEMVVVDVTEFPIKRPKRRQKQFYSGKKKRHTSNPSWWSIYLPV